MSTAPWVAYKVGGSLLELPDLAERLRSVWQSRPDAVPMLVVGGGGAADVVRGWDQTFQLGPEVAHWLAIDALDLTASLLARLMPELRLVRSRQQLELAIESRQPALLCVACFMKWLETRPERLPHGWHVTSDSIAAAVGVAWQARELVLLKSCEIGEARDLDGLARRGLVDPYFSTAAQGLDAVTWVNLRTGIECRVKSSGERS